MPLKSDTELVKELAKNSISLQKNNLDLIKAIDSLIKRVDENIKEQSRINSETLKSVDTSVDNLTRRIDRLVNLFEEATKHVGEVETGDERIKLLTAKLESLLEQNKTLAKGLLMLEKYVRGKSQPLGPSFSSSLNEKEEPF